MLPIGIHVRPTFTQDCVWGYFQPVLSKLAFSTPVHLTSAWVEVDGQSCHCSNQLDLGCPRSLQPIPIEVQPLLR